MNHVVESLWEEQLKWLKWKVKNDVRVNERGGFIEIILRVPMGSLGFVGRITQSKTVFGIAFGATSVDLLWSTENCLWVYEKTWIF